MTSGHHSVLCSIVFRMLAICVTFFNLETKTIFSQTLYRSYDDSDFCLGLPFSFLETKTIFSQTLYRSYDDSDFCLGLPFFRETLIAALTLSASVFHSSVALRARREEVPTRIFLAHTGASTSAPCGLGCLKPYVDKKGLFVDYICIFADKLVTLWYKIRGQATSITATVDMLDLRNLTPFQKRIAKLGALPYFQYEFEGLCCPIDARDTAYFYASDFSVGTARFFSQRRFWFNLFAHDSGRMRVWLR